MTPRLELSSGDVRTRPVPSAQESGLETTVHTAAHEPKVARLLIRNQGLTASM